MSTRFVFAAAASIAWFAASPARALAHGAEPVGVSIDEAKGGAIDVRMDVPASLGGGAIEVVLPDDCVVGAPASREASRAREVSRLRYACARSLVGRRIEVRGLVPSLDAVVRIRTVDGAVQREVVSAPSPEVVVSGRPSRAATLVAFAGLGVRHLFSGLDHMLFIAGLFMLARRPRPLVASLTAFTFGHSLTLAAAVLHVVAVPSKFAEVGIAASLVVLGLRVVRSDTADPPRRLAMLAGTMGLLHGLGFAYALQEIGLPESDVPLSLFGFNVGIEFGQLVVVALLALAALLVRRWEPMLARATRLDSRSLAGHALGGLAFMWCIERVLAIWAPG